MGYNAPGGHQSRQLPRCTLVEATKVWTIGSSRRGTIVPRAVLTGWGSVPRRQGLAVPRRTRQMICATSHPPFDLLQLAPSA